MLPDLPLEPVNFEKTTPRPRYEAFFFQQMKMFLTRIGFGSKAVITGDITQIDLPKNTTSGLLEAERVLSGIEEIGFNHLSALDVVRHPVVAKIIKAYEHCNL